MRKLKPAAYVAAALVAAYIAIAGTLLYITPSGIVELVGVENGYALIFVFAFVSGLSLFVGVPHQIVLLTLSAGGLNPFLLSSAATIGVMLGESTSYFLGYHGRVLTPSHSLRMQRWLTAVEKRYPKLLPFFFFILGSLPVSNDVVTIPMGLAHYPFWRLMIPLAMGNLVYNTFIAFFGRFVYEFLVTIFT